MMRETEMRPPAAAGPRGATRFGGRGGLANNMILKKTVNAELWQPKGENRTVVRPLPCLNLSDRQISVYRVQQEADWFGEWFETVPCVTFFGDHAISMVLEDPNVLAWQQNPVALLFEAFNTGKKSGHHALAEWIPYGEAGGKGKYPLIKPVGEITLFNSIIFEHGGKQLQPARGGAANDKMVITGLPGSAWKAAKELMNATHPDDRSRLLIQDAIAFNAGVFFTFIQKGAAARVGGGGQAAPSNFFGGQRAQAGDGGGKSKQEELSYLCQFDYQYNGLMASALQDPNLQSMLCQRMMPIREAIDFKSPQEQVVLCSGGFPPSLVRYAFENSDYWEFVPEHAKNRSAIPVVNGFGPGLPVGVAPGMPAGHAALPGYGGGGGGAMAPAATPMGGYGPPPAATPPQLAPKGYMQPEYAHLVPPPYQVAADGTVWGPANAPPYQYQPPQAPPQPGYDQQAQQLFGGGAAALHSPSYGHAAPQAAVAPPAPAVQPQYANVPAPAVSPQYPQAAVAPAVPTAYNNPGYQPAPAAVPQTTGMALLGGTRAPDQQAPYQGPQAQAGPPPYHQPATGGLPPTPQHFIPPAAGSHQAPPAAPQFQPPTPPQAPPAAGPAASPTFTPPPPRQPSYDAPPAPGSAGALQTPEEIANALSQARARTSPGGAPAAR